MPKITFIGLSFLECMGIRWSVLQNPATMGVDIEYSSFDTVPQSFDRIDKGECFIISSDVFSTNIEYFLPCRTRIIVICKCKCLKPNQNLEIGKSDIAYIYSDSSSEEIMELLKCRILDNIESDENSGELSLREKEVLRELSSGKTNKEIARDLSISVNTVITHRKNISSKLGIKSVSGLSLYALMNGLI